MTTPIDISKHNPEKMQLQMDIEVENLTNPEMYHHYYTITENSLLNYQVQVPLQIRWFSLI